VVDSRYFEIVMPCLNRY